MTLGIAIVIFVTVIVSGLLLLGKTNAIAAVMNQRLDVEKQIADSIRKVENVLAGSDAKGRAGENIVESALASLPPDWQVRDLKVGNKTVEFGVRLPDNLVLPIDSKLVVTDLLDQFIECEDPDEKRKLKAKIQSQTENRALEIQKYLNPNVTTSFGLAVVPDPLLTICSEITPALCQQNVMLVSYSMLIPYILLIFNMTLKAAHKIDLRRLDAFVNSATQTIVDLQGLLQSRFSKATGMLNNFKTEMEAQLSTLSANLAALKVLETSTPDTDKSEAKFEAKA